MMMINTDDDDDDDNMIVYEATYLSLPYPLQGNTGKPWPQAGGSPSLPGTPGAAKTPPGQQAVPPSQLVHLKRTALDQQQMLNYSQVRLIKHEKQDRLTGKRSVVLN